MIRRTLQVAIIAGALAVGYGSMLTDARAYPHAAATPTASPSGRIGTPLSTHKPPREPRLTMPPTDTED
jgi:hypothetical protein